MNTRCSDIYRVFGLNSKLHKDIYMSNHMVEVGPGGGVSIYIYIHIQKPSRPNLHKVRLHWLHLTTPNPDSRPPSTYISSVKTLHPSRPPPQLTEERFTAVPLSSKQSFAGFGTSV